MMWIHALSLVFMRVILFSFRGGLTNACAGAIEGVIVGVTLWLIGIVMQHPSNNFWVCLFSGLIIGCWFGGIAGFVGLGLAACFQSVHPQDENWDEIFNHLFVSLSWGGILCLFAALCGLFLMATVQSALHGTLRSFIAQWFIHWLLGSYVLGSVVGALAPDIPLWVLYRLGEVYGRTRHLFQGKSL